MRPRPLFAVLLVFAIANPLFAQAPDPALRGEAMKGLKKAATYYRTKVAVRGGYVYHTSLDLKDRWGEGKAGPDTVFVQPPGTPTVGMAFLKAYEATGDTFYRDAAKEAADALVYGQLQSGGWTQTIHFAPTAQRLGKYRNGKGGSWNASSLDDGQTQSALRMLMRMDKALDFKDAKIHEAATYGLDALLKAQFPNGAFPQVWTKPVDQHPSAKAKYPDYDWKTEGRVKSYWDYYTLNDGLAGTVAEVLIEAHQTYKDEKYRAALAKLGDFLLRAQMPDPQPGWCQQYSYEMAPIWARKFEPPAITGSESQDVMRTLIDIARYTGDKKYLEPIPRALAYYKTCLLPDGRLPRYLELKTNKPLYMDAQYRLTHDDADAPTHYGWKVGSKLDAIEREYQKAKAEAEPPKRRAGRPSDVVVQRILQDLDAEGRWVTTLKEGEKLVGQPPFKAGFQYLSSAVFSRNVEVLSEYLATGK